jgi:hypothetical protein
MPTLTRRRDPDGPIFPLMDLYLARSFIPSDRQLPRHSQGRRPRDRGRLDRDSARQRRDRGLGMGNQYRDPHARGQLAGHRQGPQRLWQFRAAWEKFSADPARLTDFLEAKRKWL